MNFGPEVRDVADIGERQRIDRHIRRVGSSSYAGTPRTDPVLSDGVDAVKWSSGRNSEFKPEEVAPGLAHGRRLKAAVAVGKQTEADTMRVLMNDDVGCVRPIREETI